MTCLYKYRLGVISCSKTKNEVKLLTQSAENGICTKQWAWENLAILFFKDEKTPDDRTLVRALPQS